MSQASYRLAFINEQPGDTEFLIPLKGFLYELLSIVQGSLVQDYMFV